MRQGAMCAGVLVVGFLAGCEGTVRPCSTNADCESGCCLAEDDETVSVCYPGDIIFDDDARCGAPCTTSAGCGEGEGCYSMQATGCADDAGYCAIDRVQTVAERCGD